MKEREQKCLDIILKSPNFKQDIKKYFGMNQNEINKINQALENATQNSSKETKFPDFIFKNGFIEHFQITSSHESKKEGAKQLKEEMQYLSEAQKQLQNISEKSIENTNLYELNKALIYPEHSYEFLCDSFKKNWENHINSYRKYNGVKDISIFMIQYSDDALLMFEDKYHDWPDEMSNGDFRKGEENISYRLSRDKLLLNYIYVYKKEIDYVIFVYKNQGIDTFEIIKTNSIPHFLKIMPWEYNIAPKMNMMRIDKYIGLITD